jgi:hypothetical protein
MRSPGTRGGDAVHPWSSCWTRAAPGRDRARAGHAEAHSRGHSGTPAVVHSRRSTRRLSASPSFLEQAGGEGQAQYRDRRLAAVLGLR